MKLTIDFETRSKADIRKSGAAAYAESPTTEVICLAIKPEGESPMIWYSPYFHNIMETADVTGKLPLITADEVKSYLDAAEEIEAHNAAFEFFIYKYVMPRYGFEMFDVEKLRCSAAKAAYYGLPRDLAGACAALGVSQQKDAEGSRLMLKMCKPRRALKADQARDADWETRTYWHESAEDLVRLGEYCLQDVRAEESLSDVLPSLPCNEQKLWRLDLEINNRGIRVDTPSIKSIVECVAKHTTSLTSEFQKMTGLSSPRQVAATVKHLQLLGADISALDKSAVDEALAATDNESVRRILEIRQSLGRSSVAKYESFLNAKCSDDRVRGSLMYYGASTGRWSGRLIQPHNFPRGLFHDVEDCIELFKKGRVDLVETLYGDVMAAAASCLRGMIIPTEGREFICADFSSIEGRVLAWLADEDSALQVYHTGGDPYIVAASAIYGVPREDITKGDPRRQIGKVAELACGYQGGVGAFEAMASAYGVNLPQSQIQEIVTKWRESRPLTVELWAQMDKAIRQAVSNPGVIYSYRDIHITVSGKFLKIKLPSQRILYYLNPRFEVKQMPWGDSRPTVAYDGLIPGTNKRGTQFLYGGLVTENITQATARDILANGLVRTECAGYWTVAHVHDEAVSEVAKGCGSVDEYCALLCHAPDWAKGLPLKAEGWRGVRYKK